jgi:hypothetical protein
MLEEDGPAANAGDIVRQLLKLSSVIGTEVVTLDTVVVRSLRVGEWEDREPMCGRTKTIRLGGARSSVGPMSRLASTFSSLRKTQ